VCGFKSEKNMKNKKIKNHIGALLIILGGYSLVATGCGPGESAEAAPELVNEIVITGNDRMRFAPTQFYVRAGDTITLTLENIGRMPKESMGHNLVIIDKSLQPNAFAAASIGFPQTSYIATQYEDKVVAFTQVLGPGEKETIVFTAPDVSGDYPFVCSFPGHTPAGMKGIMTVVE